MVIIRNKTAHQRIYTLEDGSTLRVGAFSSSEPLEDKLVGKQVTGDVGIGKLEVVSVSSTVKENDINKTDKGGKK